MDDTSEIEFEIAVQKLAMITAEKLREYRRTKDENIKREILSLIHERQRLYQGDKEIVKKYS